MTGRWGDTTGSSSVRVESVHSLGSQAALLDLEIMWVGGNSSFRGIQLVDLRRLTLVLLGGLQACHFSHGCMQCTHPSCLTH